MIFLDVNFTLFGPTDRQQDREALYKRASLLGVVAWASESQFYLLTDCSIQEAVAQLNYSLFDADFLKVQEVSGQFFVKGAFPPRVNQLFELAHQAGLVRLVVSQWAEVPPVLPRAPARHRISNFRD